MSDFQVRARVQYTPRNDIGRFIANVLTPGAIAGVNAGAAIILQHAQEIVPVDTGFLRSSGHVEEAVGDGQRSTATVSFDAHYAGYVEFGTSRMEAQPYLRPALDMSRAEIKEAAVNELALWMKK